VREPKASLAEVEIDGIGTLTNPVVRQAIGADTET
jgi:hypothetical protein